MRTKNNDMAVKIFLVVVAVILVGLIIAWSMGVFKDKKSDLDDGTARINDAISSMAEFDLLVYDGGTITGSLLQELIDEKKGIGDVNASKRLENIKITYGTLEEPTPSSYPTTPAPKDAENYINPNGLFKGEVVRDKNGVISELKFIQYK